MELEKIAIFHEILFLMIVFSGVWYCLVVYFSCKKIFIIVSLIRLTLMKGSH